MEKKIILLSFVVISFFGCKEEDVISSPELTSTRSAQDNLIAENIFNDIGNIVEKSLMENGQNKSCPSYNLINADTADVDTLIIDFGNGTPICFTDGKLRTGKIIVTYTGKYRDSLSTITTTFDNYYADYNLVQGERVITNQGKNSDGNMWFTVDINNASITPLQNGKINWQSNRQREWINGHETFTFLDDKYEITGTASGNSGNGNNFTVDITDPLRIDLGCLPSCVITSGNAKISPDGYPDRIVNYGDSLCDCEADIIINGTSYPIIIGN